MKKDLHKANHAGVHEPDAGTGVAAGEGRARRGNSGKIHMHVERFGFEGGEAVGDGCQRFGVCSRLSRDFYSDRNL